REGTGELPVLVMDVPGDLAHAGHELLAVGRDALLDLRGALPRTRLRRIVRPARSELAANERFDRSTHVRVVRRAHGLVDAIETDRIGHEPSLVANESKTEARDPLVGEGTENAPAIQPVEVQPPKPHRLE